MSSVMQPVGPEDQQVYWKRRALVVGAVVVVLFVLWLVFKPSGSNPEAEPTPVATTTTTATESARPSGSPSASPSSSAANDECADSDIKVSVTTDQDTYPSGSMPEITLSIENTGTSACKRDIGSGSNEIQVSSGGVPVYSSDTCSTSNESDEATLAPGQRANVTLQWDLSNTTVGCNGAQVAGPGAYDALGRNGKVESDEAPFVLQ